MNRAREGSWARVIIEKPFGTDLASARELNRVVNEAFEESQTYRIDHFLGKETAQNILVLRFANAIFEPLWNTRYIDHVQITAAETLGVEARAGYYETAGRIARHGAKSSAAVALPGGDGSRPPIFAPTAFAMRKSKSSDRSGASLGRKWRRMWCALNTPKARWAGSRSRVIARKKV